MFDLRNYKSIIKEAVKFESERDPNWNWYVKAINKTEIRIGWSYLDWLCNGKQVEYFTIKTIIDELRGELDLSLAGYYPHDPTLRDSLYVWIGSKHWHDAESIEEGIRKIIHAIACRAHNAY